MATTVASASDWNALPSTLTNSVRLTANFAFSDADPPSVKTVPAGYFVDGNGRTIYHDESAPQACIQLTGGTVMNLTVSGTSGGNIATFSTSWQGALVLCGLSTSTYYGVIRNCRVTDKVTLGAIRMGGLVGGRFAWGGSPGDTLIERCTSAVTLTGGSCGGMAGSDLYAPNNPVFRDCVFTGTIAAGSYVGGIVSSTSYTGTVTFERCFVAGDFSAASGGDIGGLIGTAGSASPSIVARQCAFVGALPTGGALLGNIRSAASLTVEDCYVSATLSTTSSAGIFEEVPSGCTATVTRVYLDNTGSTASAPIIAYNNQGSTTVSQFYYATGSTFQTFGSVPSGTKTGSLATLDDGAPPSGWSTSVWYSPSSTPGDYLLLQGFRDTATYDGTTYAAYTNTPVMIAPSEARIVLSDIEVTLAEGATYGVEVYLTTAPATDVTVAVASADTSEVTVSAASLTFTSSNYYVPQTVTLTAVADGVVDSDSTTAVTASVGIGQGPEAYWNVSTTVNVTVTNVDAYTIVPSVATLEVLEGSFNTFTVRLSVVPDDTTVLAVVSSDTNRATVSPSELTFTTSDYATPQTVTVTGVRTETPDNSALTASVYFNPGPSAGSAYGDAATAAVSLIVYGLALSTTLATLTEGATSNAFTVALMSRPTSSVTVSFASSDTGTATVASGTMTFTTSNWSTPQTVQLAAPSNNNMLQNTATIVATSSSSDLTYNNQARSVGVVVTNTTVAALTVSETVLALAEGASGTFTVAMAAQPASDVVLTVAASGGNTALIDVSPAALIFTNSTWSTPQTVTVTAVDDSVDYTGALTAAVTVAFAAGDANFAAVTSSVAVTVTENDAAALTLSSTTLLGSSTSFTVRLATQPLATVTVAVAAASGASLTPSALTFTTSNWATPQTVAVSASRADTLSVAVDSSSDTVYSGLSARSATVTVTTTNITSYMADQSLTLSPSNAAGLSDLVLPGWAAYFRLEMPSNGTLYNSGVAVAASGDSALWTGVYPVATLANLTYAYSGGSRQARARDGLAAAAAARGGLVARAPEIVETLTVQLSEDGVDFTGEGEIYFSSVVCIVDATGDATRVMVPGGGWRTLGQLSPGDLILLADGHPAQVRRVTSYEAQPEWVVRVPRNALGYRHGELTVTSNHRVRGPLGDAPAGLWANRRCRAAWRRLDAPVRLWHLHTVPRGYMTCNGVVLETQALLRHEYLLQ